MSAPASADGNPPPTPPPTMKRPSSAFLDRFKKKKSSADFRDAESKAKLDKVKKEAKAEVAEVQAAQAKEAAAAEEAKAKKEAEEKAKAAAEELAKKEAEKLEAAKSPDADATPRPQSPLESLGDALGMSRDKSTSLDESKKPSSFEGMLDQAADMASRSLKDLQVAMGVAEKPAKAEAPPSLAVEQLAPWQSAAIKERNSAASAQAIGKVMGSLGNMLLLLVLLFGLLQLVALGVQQATAAGHAVPGSAQVLAAQAWVDAAALDTVKLANTTFQQIKDAIDPPPPPPPCRGLFCECSPLPSPATRAQHARSAAVPLTSRPHGCTSTGK